MQRTNIPTFILTGALMLGLTACGNPATVSGTGSIPGQLNADYENALPVQNQLILGTLLLEDTDLAVTAGQAVELLPMWQLMKEISTSGTAATEEQKGLLIQIQETMTAEQIQAITDMALTQEDLMAYMQKAGLGQMPQISGTPAAAGTGGATGGDVSGGFAGGGGGMPSGGEMPSGGGGGMPSGGGMPGGGEMPSGGANLTAAQIATMEARRAGGGGGGNSTALMDALITLLETKQAA
jgi:hypothetical protein